MACDDSNSDADGAGIVYCLTNPAMPGLVKIGLVRTATVDALRNRMSVLYRPSGVPLPFELHYAVVVDDTGRMEKLLHDTFADIRENPRKEFFRIDAERVVAAMQLTRGEEIAIPDSPDDSTDPAISQADIDARNRARMRENKRLSAFNFSDAKILPGEKLAFVRDESVTAEVLNNKKIKFEGEESTLSGAARIILERMGKYGAVAGPLFWKYNGETLHEIRVRKEAEKEEELEADD